MRSRVELFEKIRRDRRLDDVSIRELADRHGVHRRTVRQALEDAVPPPRKVYPARPRPAIDAWVGGDRRLAHRRRGRPAQAAPYRPADLAAAGRRASGDALGGDGVALRRPSSGRARAADPRGVDPADASGRCRGRGRLRRVLLDDRRSGREVLDVRDATVALGQSVSRRVRHSGPGSVPGGSRAGLRVLRRCARPDPVRQPQTRRHPGPQGP